MSIIFLLEVIPYIFIGCSVMSLILIRYNILIMLLALDLILFSISLLFIYNSIINMDLYGHIYAFALLPLTVTETALGLGLASSHYKAFKTSSFYDD